MGLSNVADNRFAACCTAALKNDGAALTLVSQFKLICMLAPITFVLGGQPPSRDCIRYQMGIIATSQHSDRIEASS
ncbi:hypothetical protein FEMY_00010 [Ferrovum myxofaciens]|uniref:Uncharacterized protein n=1 Tax=Ferrovum myxofaciens TaxID=416213 RepID=A0A149W1M4_9PROT|nr:hypothetical protein FEMY_00010 [Ferrovum myxofaciens]